MPFIFTDCTQDINRSGKALRRRNFGPRIKVEKCMNAIAFRGSSVRVIFSTKERSMHRRLFVPFFFLYDSQQNFAGAITPLCTINTLLVLIKINHNFALTNRTRNASNIHSRLENT